MTPFTFKDHLNVSTDNTKKVLSDVKKALFDNAKSGIKVNTKDKDAIKFVEKIETQIDDIRKEIHEFL